jgi:hypothetical protein
VSHPMIVYLGLDFREHSRVNRHCYSKSPDTVIHKSSGQE